jgi:hypothetical protein
MPERSATIEECVEALCNEGCNKVYGYIRALEKGEEFPQVAHFSMEDRRMVLTQLVSIMYVYDGRTCRR